MLATQSISPMFKFDDLENTLECSVSSEESSYSDDESLVIKPDQLKQDHSIVINEEQFEQWTPFKQSLPMRTYPFFWNFIHKQSDNELNIVDHNGNTVLILLCQS